MTVLLMEALQAMVWLVYRVHMVAVTAAGAQEAQIQVVRLAVQEAQAGLREAAEDVEVEATVEQGEQVVQARAAKSGYGPFR